MLPGVAETDRNASGNATVALGGAFDVTVTGAVASVGLPVYINSSTYALVVAPGAGIQLFGHALQTKGAGAGYCCGVGAACGCCWDSCLGRPRRRYEGDDRR